MLKSAYHPKAFLALKRNIHPGLTNRTKILSLLETSPMTATALSQKTELSYRSVLHHLHLLEAERITARGRNKPYIWNLTGVGQQTLL
ncbi:MAG: winged helix-turn-helix domain-containing protein, partial [Candidatus Bathyarchaeota archaeon]|nr:winged helix-turn-helix domain-containing protein [Candidatus Bathyarchaeota archaeon]